MVSEKVEDDARDLFAPQIQQNKFLIQNLSLLWRTRLNMIWKFSEENASHSKN